jgi:hypothetical protein
MDETWNSFLSNHYNELKSRNPKTTYRQAMVSAAPLYKQQKERLFTTRGRVAKERRKKNRPDAGDSVEAHQYGGVLRDLKFDFNYGQGFFDDDLSWGVKGGAARGGGGDDTSA